MILQQCVKCTRRLPRLVSLSSPGFTRQLCNRTSSLQFHVLAQTRTLHRLNTQPNHWDNVRLYSTDKNPPKPSNDIPIHVVKIDLTQTVQHVESLAPTEENKENNKQIKPDKTVNKAPEIPKETPAPEPELLVGEPVQPGMAVRGWVAFKGFVRHNYDGCRLLFIEIKISARLSNKIFRGESLTRRERNQLKRTVGDVFRLVPMAMFIIIPFMELLLPVALYFFPGMLPSTFETIDKKKEKKLKKLKLKLDLAKFVQESMVSSITLQKGKPNELKKFTEFIARTRSKDPRDDIDELVSFSKLFSENLTLDNLPRQYLVALCHLLNIDTAFHTDALLRFRMRNKMKDLKKDDRMIRAEGLESMAGFELQTANVDRGMRSVGVSVERLRNQLDQWLILSLDKELPMTLLLLSRVMTLPAGHSITYEDLRNAVAHLPDSLIGEAKITLAAQKGEKIDNRSRLEAVKAQEELIKADKDQQTEKEQHDSEKDRVREEVAAKECSNTRVAANLQMRKETLKDMAKPILTEDQIEIRTEEVAEIQKLITGLRDKKNPLLEEKEEIRDLIEKALIYHMSVEDGSIPASASNKLLSNKVAKMLNHSHKVLTQLEESLKNEASVNIAADNDDVLLNKKEIQTAISQILNVNQKEKLLAILEVLPAEPNSSLKTTAVLKGLEKIAKEGTDLTAKEISAVMMLTQQMSKRESKKKET